MNSTLKPLVESAIRYALAVCVGYFGITIAQEEANTFVGVAAAVVVGVGSVLWSKYSDKKVVEQAVTK
jgi:mannitol-specific phosphotransferase system IIBC component